MSEPHLLLGRLLGLVQQMGSSHWIVLPKLLSRKGRESAEDTMLSKPQQQLESGRGAPGPRVAAHRDLVEHILQRFHEAAEDNSTWEHVAWHCWLFITAQAPSIQEKNHLGKIWGGCQQRKVLGCGQMGLCKDRLPLLEYVLRTRLCVVTLLL